VLGLCLGGAERGGGGNCFWISGETGLNAQLRPHMRHMMSYLTECNSGTTQKLPIWS